MYKTNNKIYSTTISHAHLLPIHIIHTHWRPPTKYSITFSNERTTWVCHIICSNVYIYICHRMSNQNCSYACACLRVNICVSVYVCVLCCVGAIVWHKLSQRWIAKFHIKTSVGVWKHLVHRYRPSWTVSSIGATNEHTHTHSHPYIHIFSCSLDLIQVQQLQ